MSKIAIRVDTNKIIATGHVMRCMAVAAQLIKMGADVYVISADEGVCPFVEKTEKQSAGKLSSTFGNCCDIDGAGNGRSEGPGQIYSHIMNTDWSNMESELPALIEYLRSENIDCLMVDSYQVTASYFERLREAAIHVVYMDDLCAQTYPVDAIINYNICAPHMGYEEMYGSSAKVNPEPVIDDGSDKDASDREATGAGDRNFRLYLGPRYAPLRSQFMESVSQNGTGIFLTTGGSDNLGIAEMIIRAVMGEGHIGSNHIGSVKSPVAGTESESDGTPNIHLLAGRYYEPTEYVLQAIELGKVVLHQNVDNVAEVMSTCSLAVSSAGSTLYELCAMGIPAISFTFADNQMENALGFDREGIIPYAGDFRTGREGCIRKILDFLMEYAPVVCDRFAPAEGSIGYQEKDAKAESGERTAFDSYLNRKHRMQDVTDGRGAERIAHLMIEPDKA